MYKNHTVSVVIPALNEEAAIGKVVTDLQALTLVSSKTLSAEKVIDAIIVCDNGSSDNTANHAKAAGALVVYQAQGGYGIACQTALLHCPPCDIVLFVDGDDSCFIKQAIPLLQGIVDGDDLAIGSRILGNVEEGALTSVQKFGNWLSGRLIELFWQQKVSDLGPFRAIRSEALQRIAMQDVSFGWTVEMQVKAAILAMKTSEYPVDSKIRIGQSKISGTVKGSILAGIGILSMIAKLRFGSFAKQAQQQNRAIDKC
ncbi:glycosyltransferase family 2 protein [Colwellia psychrerythraea]|uniref:Glycosyl transferase family 2 n=1 Tax=Colwellia psychrerythraea TaxID=28229 RepID=A0A099KW22_COLPS|nr:glycosyltransferase family 2 protein [Colwellia psychrerythraea]KGJ93853.1 glycosyl transferase family 2 [Colwellia psychrerythraea]